MKVFSGEFVSDIPASLTYFLWIPYRIDFHQLAAPNLANSAVLKMLEEEERQRGGKGEYFVI